MIAAPMFHSWGFAHFTLGSASASTLVLRRKFDPEDTLSATAQHECTALVVVPVMLQRILELADETIDRYDLSALRVDRRSAAARCPASSPTAVMDRFGDVLYNLYGSTEVAWATIATPEDLRAAPGTAGRPPRGTVVKLYDEDGNEVARGRDRPHLRRQRDAVRGLHRRRQQGRHRRPDVHRRRRPLRRGRAPVHRRPRRRDDRLRRRERLPARGRGPARRPRGDRRGRGHRRRRRAVRPAAEGLRRQRAARAQRGRGQEATSSRTSRATRCRARSSSSTSCRATPTGKVLKRRARRDGKDADGED